jgi:transcriptional regulator with XRE-family HTH domain
LKDTILNLDKNQPMKRLGERIRKKRESLHLQLNEVAKLAGISSSALSQIENAKAFPSIVTLKAISDSLNSTVGELIGESESMDRNPLMKYTDKKFVERNASGAELYLLSHHEVGKQMDTFLIVFAPGADTTGFFKVHSGQEFCHVIKGELEFELEEEVLSLKKGDSLYYNSTRIHQAVNIKNEPAELIWIITPAGI